MYIIAEIDEDEKDNSDILSILMNVKQQPLIQHIQLIWIDAKNFKASDLEAKRASNNVYHTISLI